MFRLRIFDSTTISIYEHIIFFLLSESDDEDNYFELATIAVHINTNFDTLISEKGTYFAYQPLLTYHQRNETINTAEPALLYMSEPVLQQEQRAE